MNTNATQMIATTDNNVIGSTYNPQARDWVIVVNNPKLNEQELFEYLKGLSHVRYFIFVRERGFGTTDNPDGTEHQHIYMEFTQPKKFTTIKNLFTKETIGVNAHIAKRGFSRQSCVDYVRKTGNHKDKKPTQISEVYEYGELSFGGQRNDLIDMVDMCSNGYEPSEIFSAYPNQYARYSTFVSSMALQQKAQLYKRTFRDVEVWYIYGPSRTGKTSYVYNKHGFDNVYSATSYDHGKWFDDYKGQDVLLLDEYRSNFDIASLLKYLDRYPLTVQCRYSNKTACFTKVYIVSNIPLCKQYENSNLDKETLQALYNRIKYIIHYVDVGKFVCEKGGDCGDDTLLLASPIF